MILIARIRKIKRAISFLIALALAAIFFSLGLWQLGRAADLHHPAQPPMSNSSTSLPSLITPGKDLDGNSINRIVTASGKYVLKFYAPSRNGGTYEVRLLQLSNGAGILVLRGVAPAVLGELPEKITVAGRLYPHQATDNIPVTSEIISRKDVLTRIDPALIAGLTPMKLYDGYISAQSEVTAFGQSIEVERIPAPPIKPTVPGFYWQHISYVIIWWLMALLVLVAPFYDDLRRRMGA
jgi:surfeit locus 1 family protein